ncbi:hypothetical protein KBB68_01570 [Candidatus Babeliales bacterium]|nr:hypothetical protein [Candidatus Babeliales bacterium]
MKIHKKICFILTCISTGSIYSDESNAVTVEMMLQQAQKELAQAQKQIAYYEKLVSKKSNVVIVHDGIVNIAPSAKNLDVVTFGGITNVGIITSKHNPKLINVTSGDNGNINVGTVVMDEKTMNECKDFFSSEEINQIFLNSFSSANFQSFLPNFEK